MLQTPMDYIIVTAWLMVVPMAMLMVASFRQNRFGLRLVAIFMFQTLSAMVIYSFVSRYNWATFWHSNEAMRQHGHFMDWVRYLILWAGMVSPVITVALLGDTFLHPYQYVWVGHRKLLLPREQARQIQH